MVEAAGMAVVLKHRAEIHGSASPITNTHLPSSIGVSCGCALASLVRREAYVLSYIYAFWLTAWVSLTEFC